MKPPPDRLGDAVRELAGLLVDGAEKNCRFSVVHGNTSAHFELRLVAVAQKKRPKRVGGVLVVYPNNNRGKRNANDDRD